MRRLLVLALTAGMALMSSVALTSADSARTVTLVGTERFVPNAFISANFRFSPGPLSVKSGDSVTWQNAITAPDPHTISIVNKSELPATVGDVFACGAPGTVCAKIFACLGLTMGGGPPPNFTCGNAANGELLQPYDTFLIPPPGLGPPSLQTVTAKIAAPPGSVLYYMCAIHPWMQGEIDVH